MKNHPYVRKLAPATIHGEQVIRREILAHLNESHDQTDFCRAIQEQRMPRITFILAKTHDYMYEICVRLRDGTVNDVLEPHNRDIRIVMPQGFFEVR